MVIVRAQHSVDGKITSEKTLGSSLKTENNEMRPHPYNLKPQGQW